jgi:acyl-CoA thioesterase FadM
MSNLRDTPTLPAFAFGAAKPRRSAGRLRPPFDEAISWPLTLEAFVEPRFVDRNAHMNVAFYAHLFDRAGLAFLNEKGPEREALDRANAGLLAIEQHLHHHAELREWDPLTIHTRLMDVAPNGVRLLHFMADPARHRVAASAEVVCACVDRTTRRAIALPAEVRRRLETYLESIFDGGPDDRSSRS